MTQSTGYDSSGYTTTVCENEGTVSRQGVYTKLVSIEGGCSGFVALVKPDTDLDDRFKAFDIDNNEWVWVNGWACDIEEYAA